MNANELLELMKKRRSIRLFEDKQIQDKDLHMILEAGLYAPNAGGRQSALFLVIQDAWINEELGKINRTTMPIRANASVNQTQPSIVDKPEIKNAFYDAPTVIHLFAPKGFPHSEADCVAAGQNMLLMAESLGLGGCMIGRAGKTFESDYGKQILIDKNISEEYQGFYHIIIGYPKGSTICKDRKMERIILL